jgi:hypothetical protein
MTMALKKCSQKYWNGCKISFLRKKKPSYKDVKSATLKICMQFADNFYLRFHTHSNFCVFLAEWG